MILYYMYYKPAASQLRSNSGDDPAGAAIPQAPVNIGMQSAMTLELTSIQTSATLASAYVMLMASHPICLKLPWCCF